MFPAVYLARLLFGCLPFLLSAQAPVEPAKEASIQTKAIAVPEIANRAAELSLSLRTTSAHTERSKRIDDIRAGLKDTAAGVAALSEYSRDLMKSPAMARTAELLNDWQPVSERLASWGALLQQRANQLEQDRSVLALAEREWELTLQSDELVDLPEDFRSRVSTALQSVRSAQKSVLERRGEVVVLQAQVAELRVQSEANIADIRAEQSRQRLGLLAFDSAPIWEIGSSRPPAVPDRPALRPDGGALMREYVLGILKRLGLFCLGTIVGWLLLRRLRGRSAAWQANPNPVVQALALVVRRPVSAAIFVAVMLSAVTARNLPSWVVGLYGLVLLIPSVRLLPGLMAENLQRPFFVLVSLLVVSELVPLVPQSSILHRPLWVIVQISIALALWWLVGLLRRRSTPGRWPMLMRWLTTVALVFAVLAALANVIGMVQLSQFLARTILLILYTAVILRGMVVILIGFLAVTLLTPRLSFLASIPERRDKIERRASTALNAIGIAAFVLISLYLSTLLDPARLYLDSALSRELNLGAVTITLYSLLAFLLVILAAILSSSALRFAISMGVYPRLQLQIGQRDAFTKILHYSVLLAGFVFAFAAAGVDLSHIAILAGGLSVGVGLGLQNVVNNFVSGLILLFERPLQVGEQITVGSTVGFVKDIGIRASVIRTFDGADVIVPNGELISGQVTNWTHSTANRRVDVTVGVAYGSDPNQVTDILVRIAKEHEFIINNPPPEVLFSGFGDSSLDFLLRFWCDKTNWANVSSQVRMRIAEEFKKATIDMPFPQRDLHIRSLPVDLQRRVSAEGNPDPAR